MTPNPPDCICAAIKGSWVVDCWGAYPNAPRKVVYIFPMKPHILQYLPKWSKHTKRVYAHNATFDMHMTANAHGDDRLPLKVKNWADTMALCRLIVTSVSANDGGDSLALKALGAKYIDPTADRYEKELRQWMSSQKTGAFQALVALLQGMFQKVGWSATAIKAVLEEWHSSKRPANSKKLTEEVWVGQVQTGLEVISGWKADYKEPTYEGVSHHILLPYLAVDCIITDLLVARSLPVVEKRTVVDNGTRGKTDPSRVRYGPTWNKGRYGLSAPFPY